MFLAEGTGCWEAQRIALVSEELRAAANDSVTLFWGQMRGRTWEERREQTFQVGKQPVLRPEQ